MIRIFFLSVFILINSGCAFIGGGIIGEVVYTSEKQNEQHVHEILHPDLTRHQFGVGSNTFIKTTDVEALWGKPSKVIVDNENKSTIYEKGLRWKGVILIAIVPIPLPVPVGHKTVTFHFKNDILVNWTIYDTHACYSYTGFNLIPLDPEGKTLGYHSGTSCDWHKDMSLDNDRTMECNVLFYDKCYPSK